MTLNSLTLSLFNNNSCSVTWHTQNEPQNPKVKLSLNSSFSNFTEFPVICQEQTSFEYPNDNIIRYYVLKSVFTNLKSGEKYFYKICENEKQSKTYTFIAPNPQKTNFNFIHISDSQITSNDGVGTGKKFTATVKGIEQNKTDSDFIIHTGDAVDWSKYENFWEDMLNQNQEFFAQNPFATISGNHETTYRNGSNETFKHFNHQLPTQKTEKGIYYSFDYGTTRFIMLNSNELEENKLPKSQHDWLLSKLQNNPQKWTIVSIHNPLYSVGKYGSNPARNAPCLGLRKQLADLFARYNVDLVLQGHDHAYSKTYPILKDGIPDKTYSSETINGIKYAIAPKGTTYVMNGPGGDQQRAPFEVDEEIYEFADTGLEYSWAEIEVKEETLTVKVYSNKNGTPALWQSYGIKK